MSQRIDQAKAQVTAVKGRAVAEAREKLAEAVVQSGFLRANWGKVSTIVVAGVAVGFALGAILL